MACWETHLWQIWFKTGSETMVWGSGFRGTSGTGGGGDCSLCCARLLSVAPAHPLWLAAFTGFLTPLAKTTFLMRVSQQSSFPPPRTRHTLPQGVTCLVTWVPAGLMTFKGCLAVGRPWMRAVTAADFIEQNVGLDGYVWVHQVLNQQAMACVIGDYDTVVSSFMARVATVLTTRKVASLWIVFDGDTPPAKASESAKRKQKYDSAVESVQTYLHEKPAIVNASHPEHKSFLNKVRQVASNIPAELFNKLVAAIKAAIPKTGGKLHLLVTSPSHHTPVSVLPHSRCLHLATVTHTKHKHTQTHPQPPHHNYHPLSASTVLVSIFISCSLSASASSLSVCVSLSLSFYLSLFVSLSLSLCFFCSPFSLFL